MTEKSSLEVIAERVFLSIPIVILGLALISWLRYGVDLPFYDDWRDYQSGEIGSFSPSYLFRPANDTMYPVGKILDALAQRFLDGNTIAYQFLSMLTILGAISWFQWKLLRSAVQDSLLAACCFAAIVFTLQPGTYWGTSNLAYHQSIPLVSFLALLYSTLFATLDRTIQVAWALVLGLLAGFSYISGAMAIFPAALVMVLAYHFLYPRRALLWSATGLALAGLIAVPAQAWVILVAQDGEVHRPSPWALPSDMEFWFYILGKVARSLDLDDDTPLLSVSVTGVIIVAMVALVLSHFQTARRGETEVYDTNATLVVFLVLAAVIATYAGILAAGRTNLGSENVDSLLGFFVHGFGRFHFFWITIIWPWGFALFAVYLNRRFCLTKARQVSVILTSGIIVHACVSGFWDHPRHFRRIGENRSMLGVACLQERLLDGSALTCPGLSPWPLDEGFVYGLRTGASFAKYFERIALEGASKFVRTSVFDIKTSNPREIKTRNVSFVQSNRTMSLDAKENPRIIVRPTPPLVDCRIVLVSLGILVSERDVARVFLNPSGTTGFSRKNSKRAVLEPGWNHVEFLVRSENGFSQVVRLDPVRNPISGRIEKFSINGLKSPSRPD